MRPKEDILITFKGKLHVGWLFAGKIDSIITSSLVFEILTYPYEIALEKEGTLTPSEVNFKMTFKGRFHQHGSKLIQDQQVLDQAKY